MADRTEEKLLRLIKLGKLHRIRSLLRKRKIVEVNSIVDDRGRTPLHISCLLGDDAVVRLLLQHGADIQTRDNDGNTPVHVAVNYALQTTRLSVYSDLILPLLRAVNEGELSTLDSRNNEGVSVCELLDKLKEAMRTRREERKLLEDEEMRKHAEHQKIRKEENEWKTKIRYETERETISSEDYMNDYSDNDVESYDDWVEKIRNARSREYRAKRDGCHEAEERRTRKRKAAERKTKQLEAEHQAYQERISEKREQAKLVTMKLDYENRCEKVFGDNTIASLTIKDIPWPCADGNSVENGKLLLRWAQIDEQNVRKFMKAQQVRWHPDRFLQRCGDRLVTEEREVIMDTVKGLSQQINDLLANM